MAISGDRQFEGIDFGSERGVDHAVLEHELVSEPAHVTWHRLEPLSLTTGALDVGLAAPVADPLWLMCRQRQFGELSAEDGGSPIDVEVTVEHSAIDRFRPGGPGNVGPARRLDPAGLLEAEAEAEAEDGVAERIRAEAGQQLLRLLRAAGAETVVADVRRTWAFEPATENLRQIDPRGAARRAVLAGRVPDAAAVLADLVDAGTVDGRAMVSLGRVTIEPSDVVAVRDAVTDWQDWFANYLHQPGDHSCWDPSRLAYSFAVSARTDAGEVTLEAAEYDSGTIDWFSFDRRPDDDLDDDPARPRSSTSRCRGIPQPARYPGMPADRFWEVEDTAVFFGGIEVGPGDLAALALIDFAVQGGTDWYQVPLDVPVGSVVRVVGAHVLTTFGEKVAIPAAVRADTSGWTAFELTCAVPNAPFDDVFLHAQTGRSVLNGPPLEEVDIIRDEMANLAWAIEQIVQGPTGEPVRQRGTPPSDVVAAAPVDLGDARLVYRLMTPVADNWHPLVPVVIEPGLAERRPLLALELREMIRASSTGGAEVRPGPLGELLRPPAGDDEARLRIAEESVLAEGVRITRRYQAARTTDGRCLVWIGRDRRVAQRFPPSALRFDVSEPPAT